MEIHWTFEGCDEQDEFRIERYWESLQLELASRLAVLVDQPSELRMAVDQDDEPPGWQVLAALHLPGRTLTAQSSEYTVEQAMDNVLSGLAEEVDQLEDTPVRVTLRRRGLEGIVPFLERSRALGQSETFMSFLVPLMQDFGSYAQRELQVREIENNLPAEQITAADLLDEALVRAWDLFQTRPKELPLDLWLIGVIDEVLEQMDRPIAQQSIDEESPLATEDTQESQQDEWVERAMYPETVELRELLPGVAGADAWDDLDLDDKQSRLAELLGKLEREPRQALLLNVAHGFGINEIADFQSRSVDQVATDIAEAKRLLEQSFLRHHYDEVEERMERPNFPRRQRH